MTDATLIAADAVLSAALIGVGFYRRNIGWVFLAFWTLAPLWALGS